MRLRVRHWVAALSLALLEACASSSGEPAAPQHRAAEIAQSAAVLPAQLRKLTNAEYDESAASLFGFEVDAGKGFADDVRSGFFTRSALQRVDETRGDQLQRAAELLAKRAVSEKLDELAPCHRHADSACAREFIDHFATRAFRRPLGEEERADLESLFQNATQGGSFADGAAAVISAVLQSASFLYVPLLGEGEGKLRTLDSYETASAISFLGTGAPPDPALLRAADEGKLRMGKERGAQFRRLLQESPAAKRQLRRFVREWLGIDRLDLVSPQSDLDYATLRPRFDAEADAFIDEVLFQGDHSLASLIAADFALVNGELAAHYGLSVSAPKSKFVRVSLRGTARRGMLEQGAFLSAHAGSDHSSPVKRGAAIAARLLCRDIPLPSGAVALSAMQVPPASDQSTTRERFAAHSTDPVCRSCHSQLDPLGFALESFDQVGRYRVRENGKAVDASGTLSGTDVDGPFADGAQFAQALSQSELVQRCFARNLFRFAAALSSPEAEEAFLREWQQLPAKSRGDLLAILSAYVESDLFVLRSAP